MFLFFAWRPLLSKLLICMDQLPRDFTKTGDRFWLRNSQRNPDMSNEQIFKDTFGF